MANWDVPHFRKSSMFTYKIIPQMCDLYLQENDFSLFELKLVTGEVFQTIFHISQ